MTFTERKGNLFTAPQGYYLAHCISGDFALGAGIAKKFDEVYNMRFKLHRDYPIISGKKYGYVGEALLVDNVFNLVSKARYFHKPTYDSLHETLADMRKQCEYLNITKLAMPRIGCGLDKLDWDRVIDVIDDVYGVEDIDIIIYSL